MKKRDSKRRWKARYLAGRWIPMKALFEHRLEAWADRVGPAWYDPTRQVVKLPVSGRNAWTNDPDARVELANA